MGTPTCALDGCHGTPEVVRQLHVLLAAPLGTIVTDVGLCVTHGDIEVAA